jgi:hypothetical protein
VENSSSFLFPRPRPYRSDLKDHLYEITNIFPGPLYWRGAACSSWWATVLGDGVAGATTATLVATSNAKLRPLGTITMAGTALFTVTGHGTIQVTIAKTFALTTGHISVKLTASLLVTVVTTSGTKTLSKVRFKAGGKGLLTKTATTTAKVTGCTIATLPAVTYARTTALKWSATNVTMAGVTVTGSCTTKTFLKNTDIPGRKISSTWTFSVA